MPYRPAQGLTRAQPAHGVQHEALGTPAVEGAGGVAAAPIGIDPRKDLTLIHIWEVASTEDR